MPRGLPGGGGGGAWVVLESAGTLSKTESTAQTGRKLESYSHEPVCSSFKGGHFGSPWSGVQCFVHFLSVHTSTAVKFHL